MANSRICSIPNCGKPIASKQVCSKHYWRIKKYGSPSPNVLIKSQRKPCLVDGCSRPEGMASDANGLCPHHLRRNRRSGSVSPLIADDGAPQRFIEDALRSETNECILWPYGKAKSGYAVVRLNNKAVAVHRHVCTIACGPPGDGLYACHTCGVRECINPRHIRFDTPSANNADMDKHKTRGTVKLTLAQVNEIRSSTAPVGHIAAAFGVSRCTVYRLRKATVWCGVQL